MKFGRRLRLGMVGGGMEAFIGPVHRMAARLDDHYELVAGAFSATPERAKKSGAAIGVAPDRCYASYVEMALAEAERSDGIEVVSIVTPNHVHYEIAKTFLSSGVHVICDKPLTTSVVDAEDLVRLTDYHRRIFVVTYNYSGYPMVRQAREMVQGGELGELRLVQVEYPQGWLSDRFEATGSKQAAWRTDPAQSGPAGCLGDIGTHAYHIVKFVTGASIAEISADLSSFVVGRQLDDNVHIMMRFRGGAKGMMWASQVAPGHENGLRLRVYGGLAALHWSQEEPNRLVFSRHGSAAQVLTRGGAGLGTGAGDATRLPAGHPEGYLEAFAQIYSDAAALIFSHSAKIPPSASASLVPTVKAGADGVRFIAAAIESNLANGAWTTLV